MWTCTLCGERIDDRTPSCWRCSTPRKKGTGKQSAQAVAATLPMPMPATRTASGSAPPLPAPPWHMCYQVFRAGAFTTWETVFTQAADFATALGPERVISISHSEDQNRAVVTIWYWSDQPLSARRRR